MRVKLKDYDYRIKEFDIDLTNCKNLIIVYTIKSGDEVVYIFDDTEELYCLDSSSTRITSYFDELKILTLEELKELNNE